MRPKSVILVGMSQVGKSTLAPRFEPFGFTRVGVDDEIEKRLGPILTYIGYAGIRDVAKWMGQPFEDRHKANSALYLEHEGAVMREVIERIERGETLVVDTTGSVVYIEDAILARLKEVAVVLHIEASAELQEELYQTYIAEPKPVVWTEGVYEPEEGEDKMEALKRCYPVLLGTRLDLYDQLAHYSIGYRRLRNPLYEMRHLFNLMQMEDVVV